MSASNCPADLEQDRGGATRGRGLFWSPCALEAGHAGDHASSDGKRWA